MEKLDFKKEFLNLIDTQIIAHDVCGLVTRSGTIYPLSSDTKVLSTLFEIVTRPVIAKLASAKNLQLVEPKSQNYYPDFTLMKDESDKEKIAIDVKTTYVNKEGDSFTYTLGGYTSFLRGDGTKNIVFPFSDYSSHWIVGYVYQRKAHDHSASHKYSLNDLNMIPVPFANIQMFVQEKWKIASDKAGSGNTTNIGSIRGKIEDFQNGKTPFRSEEEFLQYWRNYERTAKERKQKYNNIEEFRKSIWAK